MAYYILLLIIWHYILMIQLLDIKSQQVAYMIFCKIRQELMME